MSEAYSDRQLACLYQACDVTIAPGLGEGFGHAPAIVSALERTRATAGGA